MKKTNKINKIKNELPSETESGRLENDKMESKISFLNWYKFLLPVSLFALGYGFFLFFTSGFSYGTDFKGGLEKQFFLGKNSSVGQIKAELARRGMAAEVEKVVSRKNIYIARVVINTDEESSEYEKKFTSFLQEFGGANAEMEHSRLVSGVISSENKTNAVWTALVVVVLIVAYLTLRFQFRFAASAVIAVLHDVGIILSVALVFGIEVNILTIVAVLTVFGYSVNDTIILFDRVRELKDDRLTPTLKTNFADMERSVRMIFVRTVITSLTTLFVVGALFFATVGEYRDFAFLLIVGLVSGTYSSVYVALPSAYFFKWVRVRFFKKPELLPSK